MVVLAVLAIGWVLVTRSTGPDLASYYPLHVGNTWSYQVTQRGNASGAAEVPEATQISTIEQRVVGPSRFSSPEIEVFEVSQTVVAPGSDGAPGEPVESVLHFAATENAITFYETVDGDPPVAVPILQDPPAAEPLTTQRGTVSMSLRVQSQEPEAVEVPAGRFPDALARRTKGPVTGDVDGVPIKSGTIEETTWFVRDVGMVKQVRTLEYTLELQEGAAIRVEESVERALTTYSNAQED